MREETPAPPRIFRSDEPDYCDDFGDGRYQFTLTKLLVVVSLLGALLGCTIAAHVDGFILWLAGCAVIYFRKAGPIGGAILGAWLSIAALGFAMHIYWKVLVASGLSPIEAEAHLLNPFAMFQGLLVAFILGGWCGAMYAWLVNGKQRTGRDDSS